VKIFLTGYIFFRISVNSIASCLRLGVHGGKTPNKCRLYLSLDGFTESFLHWGPCLASYGLLRLGSLTVWESSSIYLWAVLPRPIMDFRRHAPYIKDSYFIVLSNDSLTFVLDGSLLVCFSVGRPDFGPFFDILSLCQLYDSIAPHTRASLVQELCMSRRGWYMRWWYGNFQEGRCYGVSCALVLYSFLILTVSILTRGTYRSADRPTKWFDFRLLPPTRIVEPFPPSDILWYLAPSPSKFDGFVSTKPQIQIQPHIGSSIIFVSCKSDKNHQQIQMQQQSPPWDLSPRRTMACPLEINRLHQHDFYKAIRALRELCINKLPQYNRRRPVKKRALQKIWLWELFQTLQLR
jgi:hypothetical protein